MLAMMFFHRDVGDALRVSTMFNGEVQEVGRTLHGGPGSPMGFVLVDTYDVPTEKYQEELDKMGTHDWVEEYSHV